MQKLQISSYLQVHIFHSFQSSNLLHPPSPWQFCPTHSHRLCHLHLCFHLVWLHGSSSIILACVDCHHLVLLHLKKALQGVDHRNGFSIAAPSHGTPHAFGNYFEKKRQFNLYPCFSGRFAGSCITVDPCFFFSSFEPEKTKHNLSLHPLMLSNVSMVQDQVSLPKEKTAQTWSTGRRHLIFHGMSLLL